MLREAVLVMLKGSRGSSKLPADTAGNKARFKAELALCNLAKRKANPAGC